MSDIEINGKSLAQVAFEAYRAEVVTAYTGDPIPAWDALDNGAAARRGWAAAAEAVAAAVRAADTADRELAGPLTTRPRPLKRHGEPLGDYLPPVVS